MRGGDLLFSIYWLYNRTGEPWLLELAHKVHQQTADWTSDVIDWHNVNMSQAFDQPTTYWLQSRDPRHLRLRTATMTKSARCTGSSPEACLAAMRIAAPDTPTRAGHRDMRNGGNDAVDRDPDGITGDLLWADRCEDVAFNSLPAALMADMKALRYLTAPNMVLSDRQSKSPGLQNGGPMLHMNPHIAPLLPTQLGPRLAVLRRAPVVRHARQRAGGRAVSAIRVTAQVARRRGGDHRREDPLPVRRRHPVDGQGGPCRGVPPVPASAQLV